MVHARGDVCRYPFVSGSLREVASRPPAASACSLRSEHCWADDFLFLGSQDLVAARLVVVEAESVQRLPAQLLRSQR